MCATSLMAATAENWRPMADEEAPRCAMAAAAAAAGFVAARLGASPDGIAAEIAAAVFRVPSWTSPGAAAGPIQCMEPDYVEGWWAHAEDSDALSSQGYASIFPPLAADVEPLPPSAFRGCGHVRVLLHHCHPKGWRHRLQRCQRWCNWPVRPKSAAGACS